MGKIKIKLRHLITKNIITSLLLVLITFSSAISFAQSTSQAPIQNISTDSNVVFRLFSTRNIHTFIKLDTRNGKMWQVQWDTDSGYRFETELSEISRLDINEVEKNGRFFLYPTENIYNFILLDQIDGRAWQVQWGKKEDRIVLRIY